MLDHILTAVEPLIVEAVALFIAALLARLAQLGARWLGAETTARLKATEDVLRDRAFATIRKLRPGQ